MNGITLATAKNSVGRGWWDLVEKAYLGLDEKDIVAQVRSNSGLIIMVLNPSGPGVLENFQIRSRTICEICGEPAASNLLKNGKVRCQEHSNA